MFTIGADPEMFVMKEGVVVPIMGMLGGTKEKPVPMGGGHGFAVQEDNVMAEYNVPPATDASLFGDYIWHGRHAVIRKLLENGHVCEPYLGCAFQFTGSQLAHPQAQVFGCSPDFDAYEQGAPLPRIQPHQLYAEEGDGAWRFAGGHVHLGYKEHVTNIPEFVVAALCDVHISIPMIARGLDHQGMRRQFYGSPGRYRPTRYGIEYRTLGNDWIHRRAVAAQVGCYTYNLYTTLQRGEQHVRQIYNDVPWNDVRRAIRTEDSAIAAALRNHLSDYGLEVG